MASRPAQIPLVAAITRELDRQGFTHLSCRQLNAVIAAADEIVREVGSPHVAARPGSGLANWFASDDTGLSSKALAHALRDDGRGAAFGVHADHPHDPADFGRCVRLLDACPELRANLPRAAALSPVWAGIVAEWDALEAMYRADAPTGKSARLYERLTAIRDADGLPPKGGNADGWPSPESARARPRPAPAPLAGRGRVHLQPGGRLLRRGPRRPGVDRQGRGRRRGLLPRPGHGTLGDGAGRNGGAAPLVRGAVPERVRRRRAEGRRCLMRKRDELTDPTSCMSRARDDEWTFVLLGRDLAAPAAVRAWIDERIRLGKNQPDDPQIVEAERWIEAVKGGVP